MKIAFLGTRGVPARYGGFETAAEEVGRRLVTRGHDLVVYCRGGDRSRSEHQGMRLVHLPALRRRSIETLSHTAVSVAHQVLYPCDVAVVFNAANAPLLPVLRARRVPTAVHVDGLEWQRGKWGPVGQRYYRTAERIAVRVGDALIADARGIQDYYVDEHRAPTWYIPYGAPDTAAAGSSRIHSVGAEPDSYHLAVARVEPENNLETIISGYVSSSARLPLIVVGGASYGPAHARTVDELAATDERVRLLGPVWDQALLDELYVNARTYLHGHSVGGTNPSLLRAAGAATPVIAYDVVFNREVLGEDGRYFRVCEDVRVEVERAEAAPEAAAERGRRAHDRVLTRYDWDAVSADYERLCRALVCRVAWRPPIDLGPSGGRHQVPALDDEMRSP